MLYSTEAGCVSASVSVCSCARVLTISSRPLANGFHTVRYGMKKIKHASVLGSFCADALILQTPIAPNMMVEQVNAPRVHLRGS